MQQIGTYGSALVLVALGLAMLFAARPREGEVVGFLKDKPNAQAFYAISMLCLMWAGIALIAVRAAGP